MTGAPTRRQVVRALVKRSVSLTRACAAVDMSRSSFRYEPRRADDVELIERIREIRLKKPRWGYKRVYHKLKGEGFSVNHKRIERIWREYGFTLPARRKRKKIRTGRSVPVTATSPNHVWTYDFMFDATFGGRRMKVLTVIDEFTREALAVVPARSLTASALIGVLAKLFTTRGTPTTIRSDNGPEFIAFELTEWLEVTTRIRLRCWSGRPLSIRWRPRRAFGWDCSRRPAPISRALKNGCGKPQASTGSSSLAGLWRISISGERTPVSFGTGCARR